jgi:hypothetical protein
VDFLCLTATEINVTDQPLCFCSNCIYFTKFQLTSFFLEDILSHTQKANWTGYDTQYPPLPLFAYVKLNFEFANTQLHFVHSSILPQRMTKQDLCFCYNLTKIECILFLILVLFTRFTNCKTHLQHACSHLVFVLWTTDQFEMWHLTAVKTNTVVFHDVTLCSSVCRY